MESTSRVSSHLLRTKLSQLKELTSGLVKGIDLVLLIPLAFAILLRIIGIQFGLPFSYHFDETTYTGAALNLGAVKIGPQINPTGFSNILFVEYAVYFVIARLLGVIHSLSDFARLYRVDPTLFVLLGRLTSALFGVLNVWVVYWLGTKTRSRAVGLLAAAFLAFGFLHVRDSHYSVPDIPMAFFASLSVLLCVLSVTRNSSRLKYLAAFTAGLTITIKWSAAPIVVPLILILLYDSWQPGRRFRIGEGIPKQALWMLLSLAGGFFVGGFELFLAPGTYLNYMLYELRAGEQGGFYFWQVDTLPGWLFYIKTFFIGLGIPFTLLAIAGAVYQAFLIVRYRRKLDIILFSFPLIYFVTIGATHHYFARYGLPLIPFAALFAADILLGAVAYFNKSRWQKPVAALAAVLSVVIIAQSMIAGFRSDDLLRREDTRTFAKDWIEANIQPGSRIAMDWPVLGPYLSTAGRPAPASDKTYGLISFMGTPGLSVYPLDWYRQQGYQYLIASSFIYQISLNDKNKDVQRREFYASLDSQLELVKEFRANQGSGEPDFIFDEIYGPLISLWQRDRPGPTIKIYRLR